MTQCYCEVEFIKNCFEQYQKLNPVDDEEELSILRSYKKLLFDTTLIVDKPDYIDELVKTNKENQIFLYLFKKKNGADVKGITLSEIDFENINPHTIFFLSDTQKCKQLEEDYGMFFISNETKGHVAEVLFGQQDINITKNGKIKNYDFLSKYRHPCNSLIINDMFLLGEHNSMIDDNLIMILRKLLPEKLNKTEFQILILSDKKRKSFDVTEKFNTIRKKIDELKKTYKIQLKIIGKDTPHNRNIITNYLIINAGNKFTLFKKNGDLTLEDETISVKSIIGFQDTAILLKNAYKKQEQDIKNILNETAIMPEDQLGTSNRLLK